MMGRNRNEAGCFTAFAMTHVRLKKGDCFVAPLLARVVFQASKQLKEKNTSHRISGLDQRGSNAWVLEK